MIVLTGWYSMEVMLMPDHEELEIILDQMMRILEVHHYKKITPCSECWFWGSKFDKEQGLKHVRSCRHYNRDKYHDEYCSDAVRVKTAQEIISNG